MFWSQLRNSLLQILSQILSIKFHPIICNTLEMNFPVVHFTKVHKIVDRRKSLHCIVLFLRKYYHSLQGQQDLDYLNPQLSEQYDWLFYYSIWILSVRSIRSVCSIRVVGHNFVYKWIGFTYPDKFTNLNVFVVHVGQRCSDRWGRTVPTYNILYSIIIFQTLAIALTTHIQLFV